MRHSKMTGYLVGALGVFTVTSVLAKPPEQAAARGLSTPAGCTDSIRGRTHILRFCGDEHYWIKRPVASVPGLPSGDSFANGGAVVQAGPAQNWGGFQRY